MIAKSKKTRILSLSIIEKAIEAIEATADIDDEILNNVEKYNLQLVLEYYQDTVEELNFQFNRQRADLIKINDLYITRERLYRILNPTIYLNAYKEKRANDAIYINANVGFIDEKGKVKNVVVFMGKSEDTDLKKLKQKIEKDASFIEDAKQKVIEKLVSKIQIPVISKTESTGHREFKNDITQKLNRLTQTTLKSLKTEVDKFDAKGTPLEPGAEKKSLRVTILLVRQLLRSFELSEKNEKR